MTILDRLLGRPEPKPASRPYKAVTDIGPWSNGIPLSIYGNEPQQRAKAYLRAYKVGWFYKAGNKISNDISTLDWSVSEGDAEEGDQEATLDRPDVSVPFESLSPIEQFQRLLEKPNPRLTGRALLKRTAIHLDFTGNACWYLDGQNGLGLPSAIYPISPARMWPSYDARGQLIGWVMDKDAPSGGVPFDVTDILWFSTGGPDEGVWGTSVVEAVYSQVPLTDMMARHTADVLTTGGRLAGMLSPKDRALSEDEFNDAMRAWRNVTSDPNAARRLLIFPEPMEYTAGASTPAEIGIPELAVLNRDEVLTAFPISPYRLGVPMPGGLNSGEVRREDRRDYWEETIHPRADLLEESIQVGLLDRYEKVMGQAYDFELAEPNMDDPESLSAKAAAYKELIAIGLDPEEALKAVALSHIKWLGLPDLLDPAKQAQAAQEARDALVERPKDDNQPPPPGAKSLRTATKPIVKDADAALRQFFRDQRQRVADDLERLLPSSKAARMKGLPGGWWDTERENKALEAVLRSIYAQTTRSALQTVADRINRVVVRQVQDPVVRAVREYGFARITDINERTRDAVAKTVEEGIRRGYSVTQLVEGVPAEGFPGVQMAPLANGQPAFDELRAETIARTETAQAYNRAALEGYKNFGVQTVEAVDGGDEDDDPECLERNGQPFSIDEAMTIEDHPNGTLDWIPVV